MKQKGLMRFLPLFVAGTLGLLGVTCLRLDELKIAREELLPKVRRLVDTNNDGASTPQEWARAYNSIGLSYDPRTSIPENLNLTRLQQIKENYGL